MALAIGGLWLALAQIPRLDPIPSLAGGATSPTFLLIGSDSRADLPDDLEGTFGSFGGSRADVVILARPVGGSLRLLSLPRDLKVDIPGNGTNKINAAYAFGGPDLLVATINNNLGLPIDHVVEIDFAGFADLVDSVGGIDIAFEFDARDAKSGLDVAAGTTTITGPQALAYVRSRSYQELQGGSWVSVDADDIGRTGRQQQALTALLDRVASPAGLARGPAFVSALSGSVKVDDQLGVLDMVATALGMRSAEVDAATLPVRFSNEGGVSYVVADGEEASRMLERFSRGEPLDVASG